MHRFHRITGLLYIFVGILFFTFEVTSTEQEYIYGDGTTNQENNDYYYNPKETPSTIRTTNKEIIYHSYRRNVAQKPSIKKTRENLQHLGRYGSHHDKKVTVLTHQHYKVLQDIKKDNDWMGWTKKESSSRKQENALENEVVTKNKHIREGAATGASFNRRLEVHEAYPSKNIKGVVDTSHIVTSYKAPRANQRSLKGDGDTESKKNFVKQVLD